ncbi:MAG: aminotransferase class I/II-fold pyridoxal phosphate-dependent enzyme [Candidatus Obscuribacterales bacterium]|nr:aminotransferase class I/II-fold pyridoxal phosphate-dependent enzyme [Candidatus Obscuribacterales bacterium]
MTQSTFLAETQGSRTSKSSAGQSLLSAVKKHLLKEKASFHTPGHKGRLFLDIESNLFSADLTELPGLDELSAGHGVLRELEERASKIWSARRSFISVNGASAALAAAIMSAAGRGSKILVPRNVHRSALNALVLSGLEALWYEAEWLSGWQSWGETKIEKLKELIDKNQKDLAAVLLCSPNYAGCASDIKSLSSLCKERNLPLIVDAAHGAHLFEARTGIAGALEAGADIAVHSLHKTLTAPTQTGLLQIAANCPIEDSVFSACLNTLQSSSPSYLLMLGIEKAFDDLDSKLLESALCLSSDLKNFLANRKELEVLSSKQNSPFHILIKHESLSAENLYEQLAAQGVFAESILGNGVLLLLGLNSNESDIAILKEALSKLEAGESTIKNDRSPAKIPGQIMSPRAAFFADSKTVKVKDAVGEIASDWVAPCPPGYAILLPGQRIEKEIQDFMSNENSLRVVKHPQLEGDTDGSNTAR